jgi:hypothetical protein
MEIVRKSPPTLLDELPQGTICLVHKDNDCIETYEQQSDDSANPKWVLID